MAPRMNCREVALRVQTYLDGELDQARLDGIRNHLDACVDCGLEAEAFRQIKAKLADCAPDTDPVVLDRLRQFTATIRERAATSS